MPVRYVFCLLSLALPALCAQGSPREQFEDLARRAETVLDSRPQEAADLFKQALALQPAWAEGWLSLGAALYQLHRYAEATDALRKGVELAPGIGTGWGLLGLSESQLDDQDQALADIAKGESLGFGGHDQFDYAVRGRAAQLLIQSSTFDEALAQLQPLWKKTGLPPVMEMLMGLCTLALPEDVAKLPDKQRPLVDLAGKTAWAVASNHPEEAAAGYRQLLAQYPNEPGVHYAYGLYLMESDLNAALAEFQKEVQINPGHWPALLAKASLEIRQGTPDAAIATVHDAMKVVPARYRWICHSDLGRANLDLNKTDAAIAELETAVRQKPSNPNVHFFLSQAYRRAGRKADAEKETAEFEKVKAQQDPLALPAIHPFGDSGKH
ncbi:MAG TPA: tetratricopeptide repeat protein [Bryobacteraceae bacterium]|nr:tetratricopeptide repeat protein [Bryobacteraceae bacterium]